MSARRRREHRQVVRWQKNRRSVMRAAQRAEVPRRYIGKIVFGNGVFLGFGFMDPRPVFVEVESPDAAAREVQRRLGTLELSITLRDWRPVPEMFGE